MKGERTGNDSIFTKLGLPLGDKATRGLFAVSVLIVVASATRLLWQYYGKDILSRSGGITEQSIVIPPIPAWIRSDVRAEAVREGSLANIPLNQEDLTLRVAQAFRLHAWVANVRRVRKQFGNKIIVDIDFRSPVAMVEVHPANQGPGLFPVDANGYFLPPGDFMPAANPTTKVADFPRIRAEGAFPQGIMPGTSWGDLRIQRGARLAARLMPVWNRMELALIIAHRGTTKGQEAEKPEFELRTKKNTIVFWGRAPDDEEPSEPRAEKKIALLADFVQRKGSLDAIGPEQTIDVRHIEGLDVATLGRKLE